MGLNFPFRPLSSVFEHFAHPSFKQSIKTRRTTLNKDIVYRQSVETFMDIYMTEQKPKFNTIRDAQVMTALLINIASISENASNVCYIFYSSYLSTEIFRRKHRRCSAKTTSFQKKHLATFLQVNKVLSKLKFKRWRGF